MVKKCLMAIAVVALLATTVSAATNPMKNEGWPFQWEITYDSLEICKFDVVLEVGYYVQIKRCGDLLLKLEQVDCGSSGDFPCYEGCVKTTGSDGYSGFKARANFAAIFGAKFEASDGSIVNTDDDNVSLDWEPADDDQITVLGSWETFKICMTAKKVSLWDSGDTDGTVTVGEIIISVKPPLDDDSGDQSTWPPSP